MINIVGKIITLDGNKKYSITKMEVWWHVDTIGLVTTIEELGTILQSNSEPVKFYPIPVAVSRTDDGQLVMYETVQ